MKIKPYQQGSLDGYCGMYCMVNIVHYIDGPISTDNALHLLSKLLAEMHVKVSVDRRLTDGVSHTEIIYMLRLLKRSYPIRFKKAFPKKRKVTLQEYWSVLSEFIHQTGGLALICAEGYHDHWTLVRGITNRSLLLFDSDGMGWLPRKHCTTGEILPNRRHYISPYHTLLIWRDRP